MQFQECLAEASGESRSRFCNSTFCTSQFSCETRQEVILCLSFCQDRYWRKYTKCICGQEDNVFSCRCRRNRANDFFDVVDRVGNTCVFCNALISEINLSVCINSYVLKKSVTFDCIVDVWLRFFVKVDNFSVASAFEVEYAVVIPAMLVITCLLYTSNNKFIPELFYIIKAVLMMKQKVRFTRR